MLEEDLIKSLSIGSEAAYHFVFEKHYRRLVVFANRIVTDHDHAKDVVQNCFIKIYEKRKQLAGISNLSAYLYRTVHNEALNSVRTQNNYQRHKQSFQEESIHESMFNETVESVEKEHRLYEAIQQLPVQCRKVFVMSRLDGKKNSEIASELDLSIRTVETHISNAIKSIKQSLLLFIFILF